jgi:hypothetical protein
LTTAAISGSGSTSAVSMISKDGRQTISTLPSSSVFSIATSVTTTLSAWLCDSVSAVLPS